MNDAVLGIFVLIHITTIAALGLQMILSSRERKDLYDRLMSANIGEYRSLSEKKKADKPLINAHRRAIDAFHARGTGMKPEE